MTPMLKLVLKMEGLKSTSKLQKKTEIAVRLKIMAKRLFN
jgi:hypothetical protein